MVRTYPLVSCHFADLWLSIAQPAGTAPNPSKVTKDQLNTYYGKELGSIESKHSSMIEICEY
jgi:hypothetical protein